MGIELTKQQHRFLKNLAASGTAPLKDLRPKLKPAEQSSLVEASLVTKEKPKKSFVFTLTAQGRAWISDHPEWSPPPKPFPKAGQRLFLLQLAFMGGVVAKKDLKSAPKGAEKTALLTARLLEENKGAKGALLFTLTDSGWKWAEDHLADPVNTAGVKGAPAAVLQHVLVKVGTFLAAGNLHLADLIRTPVEQNPTQQDEQPHASHSSENIEQAIEAACLRLGGGQTSRRLRLADLRPEILGWDRATQDRALLELSRSRRLVLNEMEDPQEIQPSDREAELTTPSGAVRHLVYWTGPRADLPS